MPSINFIDPFANNGEGKIVKTIEFNNERDKESGILISRYEERTALRIWRNISIA